MYTTRSGQGLSTVVFQSPYGAPAHLRVQPQTPLPGPYSQEDMKSLQPEGGMASLVFGAGQAQALT